MNMTDDLALKLRKAYEASGSTGKVVAIHLFGIQNAGALSRVSLADVVSRSGINDSYRTEVRKGMNLAPYVAVK